MLISLRRSPSAKPSRASHARAVASEEEGVDGAELGDERAEKEEREEAILGNNVKMAHHTYIIEI